MIVIETERLQLRYLSADDAPFIVELLNDPDWLRFIGDKSVRKIGDAHAYLRDGPIAMYAREGFGLYLVVLKTSGEPIGLCGLIRRSGLVDVDIGFAFLPAFRGSGYALESAAAVLAHGRDNLGLERIVAITTVDNERSIRVLERLGLVREQSVRLPGDDQALQLYAWRQDARP